MASRNVWLDKELKLLLEIFQTQNINRYFDTKYKNGEIYQLVYEELVKKGVTTKSVLQIKNKWKALKCMYYKVKRKNGTSGRSPFRV